MQLLSAEPAPTKQLEFTIVHIHWDVPIVHFIKPSDTAYSDTFSFLHKAIYAPKQVFYIIKKVTSESSRLLFNSGFYELYPSKGEMKKSQRG